MKKTFRTVAFLVTLSIASAGCQKEPIVESQIMVTDETNAISVVCTIDGVCQQYSFSRYEEWHAFLDQLFKMAENGRTVSFYNAGLTVNAKQTRKIVTYETSDEKDAMAWAEGMRKDGYRVTIMFDASSGKYTCIAVM